MGESRYFTAHGTQPSGGSRDPAWTQNQWSHHHAQGHDVLGDQEYFDGAAHGWPGAAQPASSEFAQAWPGSGAPRMTDAAPYGGYRGSPPLSAGPRLQASMAGPQWPPQPSASWHPSADDAYPHAQPEARHANPAGAVRPLSFRGLTQGLGAVLSLVLMVGGAVWTWQMMQRDVSGVPVVRALEGPLRVAPDDPGGRQAAHQGLSVNELAASGASGLPDEIVLAPPPLDLSQEAMRPAAQPETGGSQGPEMLIEIGLPLPGTDTSLGFVTPNRSAVTSSPRPVMRSSERVAAPRPSAAPADPGVDSALAAAVANTVAAELSRAGGIDVDPASIGPGTRLVQLGAYDNAAEARSAWDALAQRFSPLLDDRGRVIEAAHSGGSVFYRLRAHGFSDERDARRFCAALIDQRFDCIPVLIR